MTPEEMEKQIDKLSKELRAVREDMEVIKDSPYVQSSIKNLSYEVLLDRDEIVAHELGKKINEKHGTMYEIKTQAKRLAQFLGLDADMVRLMVTEALQNILEHGAGRYASIRLEINNDSVNPHLIATFKHEMPVGRTYTLGDVNQNALKGDVTSEQFDFESSRGRGEYIMKQLTDERRIINGSEINRDGQKVHYFKRILVNYKHPGGARERINFEQIKHEIDRLDYEDVVCCFHVDHVADRPDRVTIATHKSQGARVADLMSKHHFRLEEQEPYYRTLFATYVPSRPVDQQELLGLFSKVRQVVYEESDQN